MPCADAADDAYAFDMPPCLIMPPPALFLFDADVAAAAPR